MPPEDFPPSVCARSFQVSATKAEVVLFAPAGTRFHADALQRVASAFVAENEAIAVYGDFDLQGADGSLWPIALPAFDYERMLEQGYCCRVYAMRRDALSHRSPPALAISFACSTPCLTTIVRCTMASFTFLKRSP